VTERSPTIVPARRVLVIANPEAGRRRGGVAGDAAARALASAGFDVELRRTESPGDATRWGGNAARDEFDLVVAAGGDGTVNEVANGLAGTGVALGVAPAGTMNLLARVLGLPLDPREAVLRIVDGYRPLNFRPGTAAERLFLLMAGAGFDAWVLRELLRSARAKIGFGDYVRGALRGLSTYPFPRLAVRIEDRSIAAHTAIVGRAPLYGGFLRPTPHARLDVDRLELCALEGNAVRLALTLPRLWSGAHEACDGVTLAPTGRVEITADRDDIPYHLDGELSGTLPVTIELAERILSLATPWGST
jgi:YegS/Rv2252/BmrU family lipid kinase